MYVCVSLRHSTGCVYVCACAYVCVCVTGFTGALLSIRCHLYLGRPGVWSFRVQTAGGSTSQTGGAVRLVVGGQQVPLTTVSTGTGSVTGGGVPVMSQGAIVAHTAGKKGQHT